MKYLVTMLVGVIVDAEDSEAATKRAILPIELGALPNVIGIAPTGTRPADDDDTKEKIAERLREIRR